MKVNKPFLESNRRGRGRNRSRLSNMARKTYAKEGPKLLKPSKRHSHLKNEITEIVVHQKIPSSYFRELYNSLPVAYFSFGKGGRILDANVTAARSLQTSLRFLIGQSFTRYIHPDDRPLFTKLHLKVSGACSASLCNLRICRPGGSQFWARVYVLPRGPDAGPAECFRASLIDLNGDEPLKADLFESLERYRALIESAPDGILINQNSAIVYANVALLKLLRAERATQMLGRSPLTFLHPDHHEEVRFLIEELLANGGQSQLRGQTWLRLDGSRIVTDVTAARVIYRGRPAIQLHLHDVSETRQVEEKLRRSEAELAEAQAQARIGSWQYDLAEDKIRWSRQMYKLFNRDPKLGPPSSFKEALLLTHPSDRHLIVDYLERAKRAMASDTLEFRSNPERGPLRWLETRSAPERDSSGNVIRLLGTVQDITERKEVEEALRSSRERLQLALEGAGLGTWHWNILTGELLWSVRCLELFGLPPGSVITYKKFLAAVHPYDRSFVDAAMQHALHTKSNYRIEFRTVLPDKSLRWIASMGRGYYDAAGKPLRMEGVVMDITATKQATEQAKQFAHELFVVREEERKKIATVLHHDVGSVAIAFTAHLDTIEAKLVAGNPKVALEWTKKTRNVFKEALAELRQLSRELRPPELDVVGLGAALRLHLANISQHGGVQIRFRERHGAGKVSGDAATVLFRVAQEAVTNALNHGKAKKINITLDTLEDALRLTVKDLGAGFDAGASIPKAGSGLGLSILRELVASAEGTCLVDSQPNRGTTVQVLLPKTKAKWISNKEPKNLPTDRAWQIGSPARAGSRWKKKFYEHSSYYCR